MNDQYPVGDLPPKGSIRPPTSKWDTIIPLLIERITTYPGKYTVVVRLPTSVRNVHSRAGGVATAINTKAFAAQKRVANRFHSVTRKTKDGNFVEVWARALPLEGPT